ncbi:SH3 domain-containing protein Dlish [Tetranychus urticae]|nr:SH3 domain-containing protein Dlish [Tetranychus urticae]XP_015789335.1 SH3 domain-containing protein Dlish [Tetranychus urticae]
MAFLCSARVRRNKKTKDIDKPTTRQPILGRITGSNSIETLVRVGIEKENGLSPDSKMVVLHDFNPCVDDELEVKRGQIVNILYQEKGWIYVIAENNQEGFIPHSYCAPIGSHLADLALNIKHKKSHRNGLDTSNTNDAPNEINHHQTYLNNTSHHHVNNSAHNLNNINNNNINNNLNINNNNQSHNHHHQTQYRHLNHHYSNSLLEDEIKDNHLLHVSSAPPSIEVSPFHKDPSGHYIVLFTFIARDENDVSVERGESVTVLNKEDTDWFWIVRSDGQEGFVPSAFLCPFEMIQDPSMVHQQAANSSAPTSNGNSCSSINRIPNGNGAGSGSGCGGEGEGGSASGEVNSGSIGNHRPNNNHHHHHHHHHQHHLLDNLIDHNSPSPPPPPPSQEDSGELLMTPVIEGRPFGTELVMLYDYKAQAPDDLSVRRGDWIYANYNNQKVDGWLWAYAPKIRKYGFIPKAYARPPAITS